MEDGNCPLLGAAPRAAQQNDARTGGSGESEQVAEIGVCGNEDTTIPCGSVEDSLVGGAHQIQVGHMEGVVPGLGEEIDDSSLERLVDQELHAGSWRGKVP